MSSVIWGGGCLVLGYGSITDAGCLFVGQTMERVNSYALNDAGHVVADGIEDVLVPLHGGAGG